MSEGSPSILSLDLGTKTGWALRTGGGHVFSGPADFRPGRYEGGGMRFLRFRSFLGNFSEIYEPAGSVWFEEVRRHAGVDAAHIYGGFLATLAAWCEEREIPYTGVPVGTIKRRATGKGNANKEAVIAAVRSKGYDPKDDNEADALALLLFCGDG